MQPSIKYFIQTKTIPKKQRSLFEQPTTTPNRPSPSTKRHQLVNRTGKTPTKTSYFSSNTSPVSPRLEMALQPSAKSPKPTHPFMAYPGWLHTNCSLLELFARTSTFSLLSSYGLMQWFPIPLEVLTSSSGPLKQIMITIIKPLCYDILKKST